MTLLEKNQIRHWTKIQQIDNKNSSIYNQYAHGTLKNLAIATKVQD